MGSNCDLYSLLKHNQHIFSDFTFFHLFVHSSIHSNIMVKPVAFGGSNKNFKY